MYFVIAYGTDLKLTDFTPRFHNREEAIDWAEKRKVANGKNYHVLKLETIWTTQTLGDLKRQGAF
jgi:hypothetical protein